ncbi:sortase-dependent protein [Streptomyces fructofermentans]|uniref:sortase-dependent protein n=1 Tax=Streptomyces fructofermentans TaxID=152141 RepID=UPI0033F35F0E
MRRTVLSTMALACTAVLAGAVPAFADDPSPVPTSRPTTADPAPSAEPTRAPDDTRPAPSTAPTRAPSGDQVSVVPSGAPDTGVAPVSSGSGSPTGLIGAGAATVFAAGGAAVFVVRRRRATGA